MALSSPALKALILTNVAAATGQPVIGPAQEVWGALADAIITHLTTAGLVTVVAINGTPSGVMGVTTAGALPITGVATGLIT